MRYRTVSASHDWPYITELWEDFYSTKETDIKTYKLKELAAEYLDTDLNHKLTKHEIRALLAKAEKMKVSNKKETRARGQQLAKQIQQAFNIP